MADDTAAVEPNKEKPDVKVTYWSVNEGDKSSLSMAWGWLTDDLWRLAALGMAAILLIAVVSTITSTAAHKETGERVRCFRCLTQTNGIVMGKLAGVNSVVMNEAAPNGQPFQRIRTYLVYVCKAGHIQMVERDATVVDTAAVGK